MDFYIHVFDDMTLSEYMISRYNGWSARLVIDIAVALLVRVPRLWKCLTVLVAVALYRNMVHICTYDDRLHIIKGLVFVLMMIYPFYCDMQSAGWVATSVNYFWVCAALFWCLRCLYGWYDNKSLGYGEVILFVICFVFGTNQEQAAVVFEIICCCLLIAVYVRDKRIDKRLLLSSLVGFGVLIFESTCPGNDARMISNVAYWMPAFADFTLFDKTYMGLYAIYKYFICGYEWYIKPILVMLIICSAAYVFFKNLKKKTIACVAGMIMCTFAVVAEAVIILHWPKFGLFGGLPWHLIDPGTITDVMWEAKRSYIPVFVLIFLAVIIILAVCVSRSRKKDIAVMMFIAGAASEFIMGFSPTIWASNNRTAIFTFFLWGMATIIMCEKSDEDIPLKGAA